jgi:hypothetical protein
MGGSTAGLHHPLGDALIEVGDFLPQVMLLEQHRATSADLQRVVGAVQTRTLSGRQVRALCATWPCRSQVDCPVGLYVSGPRWSFLDGSGPRTSVGSSTDRASGSGAPGISFPGRTASCTYSTTFSAADTGLFFSLTEWAFDLGRSPRMP